jgi:hypothetical protein
MSTRLALDGGASPALQMRVMETLRSRAVLGMSTPASQVAQSGRGSGMSSWPMRPASASGDSIPGAAGFIPAPCGRRHRIPARRRLTAMQRLGSPAFNLARGRKACTHRHLRGHKARGSDVLADASNIGRGHSLQNDWKNLQRDARGDGANILHLAAEIRGPAEIGPLRPGSALRKVVPVVRRVPMRQAEGNRLEQGCSPARAGDSRSESATPRLIARACAKHFEWSQVLTSAPLRRAWLQSCSVGGCFYDDAP